MNRSDSGVNFLNAACGALGATRLVRTGSLDRIREGIALIGYPDLPAALFQQVQGNVKYLERCLDEAQAVLRGNLAAATRLWLLLNESVGERAAIPESALDEIFGRTRYEPPQAIDGNCLLTLVAGVVRAANQPVEAEAMLDSLGRLLDPLFLIEYAARAAEQALKGQTNPLKTLLVAWQAPQWRTALTRDNIGFKSGPISADAHSAHSAKDRVPFEPGSWLNPPSPAAALDRSFRFPWPCLGITYLQMSQIDRWGPRYMIESISNQEACAGETITIRGRDFGPTGRVRFPLAGNPEMTDPVDPMRWTDTEIDVVVPPWAASGELHLDAFTHHEDHQRCWSVDVYRLGNTIAFLGGLAAIVKIFLNGKEVDLTSKSPTNLKPGDNVVVGWLASSGSTVRVTIEFQLPNGSVLLRRVGLPGGSNSATFTVPVVQAPTPMVLVLSATSSCGPATKPKRIPIWVSVPPVLSIEYIEVTQGVQTDLADVLAGRGMPTVAYKDTAVRVHLRCDRGGWFQNQLDKITGELRLDNRQAFMPTNRRPVIPDAGYAAVVGLSDPNRTNDTLNFTIPAAYLTPGFHSLTIRIACNDQSGRITLRQKIDWVWHEKSPLRVRCLWLAIDGQSHIADMLDYAARAFDFLPTPLTDIGITSRVWYSHNYDLSTNDGWSDLLDDIEDEWGDAGEASGVRWLGIIPASERRPGSVPPFQLKWGGISNTPGVVALAMGDRPEAAAHELGHTLGLNHVYLANDNEWFPKGPYDSADNGGRLRRPPFDIRSSQAVQLPAGDLMSYFDPVRPGITTWIRLFNMQF